MSEGRDGVGAMFSRDEQGRFTSQDDPEGDVPAVEASPEARQQAEGEPQPQEQQLQAETPRQEAQPATIPLATFLDVQNELKELKRQRKADPVEQPQGPPSFYDDPDGYMAHFERQRQEDATRMRIEMSTQFAMRQHGVEALEAARKWGKDQADIDPSFSGRFGAQPDPVGWLVSQHKQSELLGQIGDDPDAYVRRRAAELGLVEKAAEPSPAARGAQAVQQPAPVQTAPRSLATAPNAGTVESVSPAGVSAMFG